MKTVHRLLALIQLLAASRAKLVMENVALRQQIIVLKRTTKKARIEDSDRVFWVLLGKLFKDWKDILFIVQPETVIRWHREGFAYYWKRKSRSKPGRPPIGRDVIALIKRMARENPTWGAPRIASELALVGVDVGQTTVAKYMPKVEKPPSQSWRTFLANHMDVSAACDFFVVPTLTFNLLYAFIVLSHDRRRILHVNVTKHPTDEWTAQQVVEAFPGDQLEPRFLHRDGDSIYGDAFENKVDALGIDEVVSAPKSPWQNPFCERVIGSVRRDCTDHIIALGERHLLRALLRYQVYYNQARTHLSLDRNSPEPREVERRGKLIAIPHLGGLHHRYARVA